MTPGNQEKIVAHQMSATSRLTTADSGSGHAQVS